MKIKNGEWKIMVTERAVSEARAFSIIYVPFTQGVCLFTLISICLFFRAVNGQNDKKHGQNPAIAERFGCAPDPRNRPW
ncbi:MAG: hypothetical protein LBT00_09835 [Spirochaetaceae bacterium]|nr:hypothetical protein [Spirochaetaceae bacterium]